MTEPTVSEPRTRTGRLLLNDSWRHENDPDNWRDSLRLRILAIEAEAAQPIDVERPMLVGAIKKALDFLDPEGPGGSLPMPAIATLNEALARLRASDTDQ